MCFETSSRVPKDSDYKLFRNISEEEVKRFGLLEHTECERFFAAKRVQQRHVVLC